MGMRERTAALIPCANDDYSLFLCVQAVAEAVDEVVLLDDASEDQTQAVIDWLCARYPHVNAKRSNEPLGWAEARNVLAEMTDARHLFFIDADDIFAGRLLVRREQPQHGLDVQASPSGGDAYHALQASLGGGDAYTPAKLRRSCSIASSRSASISFAVSRLASCSAGSKANMYSLIFGSVPLGRTAT